MVASFEFVDDGRTFRCIVEPPAGARKVAWWWFEVSGDTHRYAPFQVDSKDSRDSVRTRVVQYYTNHVARRLAPPAPRGQWARRQQTAPAGTAVVGAVVVEPAELVPPVVE